jgi:hypothetical protein
MKLAIIALSNAALIASAPGVFAQGVSRVSHLRFN